LSDTYAGRWQAESITQGGTMTPVPATSNAWATFSAQGRIRLFDTVNTTGGRFEAVKGGFAIREASTSLVLYTGGDQVRLRVMAAFKAMAGAGRVAASITGNRLTVTAGEFRIVFTRTT
jgi:hypothetical protein